MNRFLKHDRFSSILSAILGSAPVIPFLWDIQWMFYGAIRHAPTARDAWQQATVIEHCFRQRAYLSIKAFLATASSSTRRTNGARSSFARSPITRRTRGSGSFSFPVGVRLSNKSEDGRRKSRPNVNCNISVEISGAPICVLVERVKTCFFDENMEQKLIILKL